MATEYMTQAYEQGDPRKNSTPVSYTHLDVYKRQGRTFSVPAVQALFQVVELGKIVVIPCTEKVCLLYTSNTPLDLSISVCGSGSSAFLSW